MKRIIYLSFAAISLTMSLASCGGDDKAKNAFEQGLKDADNALKNSTSSGSVSEDWLASANGKKWNSAKKDYGPFTEITLWTDKNFKTKVLEGTWRLEGDQFIIRDGFDIKYTITKTSDTGFDIAVSDGTKYSYVLDGGASSSTTATTDNSTTTTTAPSTTTATTSTTSSSTTSASTSSDTYAVGDKVKIKWNGQWYAGVIKEVKGGGKYKIGYDGYDATWDETVGTDRLKR